MASKKKSPSFEIPEAVRHAGLTARTITPSYTSFSGTRTKALEPPTRAVSAFTIKRVFGSGNASWSTTTIEASAALAESAERSAARRIFFGIN